MSLDWELRARFRMTSSESRRVSRAINHGRIRGFVQVTGRLWAPGRATAQPCVAIARQGTLGGWTGNAAALLLSLVVSRGYHLSMRAADTTTNEHAVQLAVYRRLGAARRIELAAEMSEDARRVSLAGIGARHPGYGPQERLWALRRLLLGDELFGRAWPSAPRLAP